MGVLLSFILLASCLVGPAYAANGPATSDHVADVAAIQNVVEQFKAAIIARDGDTLANLFLQDHDSWLSVADEVKWTKAKALNPQARKVFSSSWKNFSEFIRGANMPVEERFHNVRIETNGAVASVWFDFDFLADGKVTNRGSESWQMVRAEDGWKIGAMLYSMGE